MRKMGGELNNSFWELVFHKCAAVSLSGNLWDAGNRKINHAPLSQDKLIRVNKGTQNGYQPPKIAGTIVARRLENLIIEKGTS